MTVIIDGCSNDPINGTFHAAIYCRLSREDEERNSKESESIVNQRDYLTKTCMENKWNLVDVYVDDGYSGTSFERPAFKRMIADIENKKINLVITKDLSRLGRDYIMTGHYLEKYFPSKNIRYIAINDGIDTFVDNGNNDMSPFRSVINDMYARDISRKVKSVMDNKRFDGKFIGAFAPFGYLKDPLDKNKLIIDPSASHIIKRIFEMYLDGHGYTFISNALNLEKVKSPNLYKAEICNYKNPKARLGLWTHETVKRILTSPTYSGHLTQNRCKKVNYKVKGLKNLPKSSWIVIKNTHDAIISDDVFDKVQNLADTKASSELTESYFPHLLAGMLYCADCKERMTFVKTKKGERYAICSKYKRFSRLHECTRHSILESKLEAYVIDDLRKISMFAADYQRLLAIAENNPKRGEMEETSEEMNRIKNQLGEIRTYIRHLYEDKLKGVLAEEDFIDLSQHYHLQRDQLNQQFQYINKKAEKLQGIDNCSNNPFEFVKALIDFKNISRSILIKIVDRIEIYENKKIDIHYRFKSPF